MRHKGVVGSAGPREWRSLWLLWVARADHASARDLVPVVPVHCLALAPKFGFLPFQVGLLSAPPASRLTSLCLPSHSLHSTTPSIMDKGIETLAHRIVDAYEQ